jgi:hypothetical protein
MVFMINQLSWLLHQLSFVNFTAEQLYKKKLKIAEHLFRCFRNFTKFFLTKRVELKLFD